MTTTDRSSGTVLPPVRRKRRQWGRLIARALCALFAIIGLVPVAGAVVARSAWARGWATRETSRVLRDQGVHASYEVGVKLWPLSVVLTNVRVESVDGGLPALTSTRAMMKPRLFALMAGKLAIDEVDVESPAVRVVIDGKSIANLGMKIPDSDPNAPEQPWPAPFSVVSLTDAKLDAVVNDNHFVLTDVDLDVTSDQESRGKSAAFEIATRIGEVRAQVYRELDAGGSGRRAVMAVDNDMLCTIDGRLRVEQHAITVHRFSAKGSVDLDPTDETWLGCNLPASDARRIDVSLSHLSVKLPTKPDELPRIDGHVAARAPIQLVERLGPKVPATTGWVGVDVEARYSPDALMPEAIGHIEAHDVSVAKYNFARSLDAQIVIRKNVVSLPTVEVQIADGTASFTEVVVEPFAKGVPLTAKGLEVRSVNFTALMHDLGISPHPHVAWDIQEVHTTPIKGTLVPLHLDLDFSGKTVGFVVYNAPVDSPARGRIIGVTEARVASHLAVRPTDVEFQNPHVETPRGKIDGQLVALHYNNELKIDVSHAAFDLADITPLGDIPLAGKIDGEVHVTGWFGKPVLLADAKVDDFVLGDIPFGNVSQAHAKYEDDIVTLTGIKATKGKSPYELTSGRLDFRGPAVMKMDGIVSAQTLGARDLFAMFKMEDDPRFTDLDAQIETNAQVKVILGGPEDPCGGGRVDVAATAHLENVSLYGEKFDDAHLDFDLKWADRNAGLAGADLDVRALTLHKLHTEGKAPVGWVLGSATIHPGGDLHGTVVLESLPLSKLDSLGASAATLEGSISGLAAVSGTVDAFRVEGDIDATPIRFRGAPFGSSRVHLVMTQAPSNAKSVGKTRCGAPMQAVFDKDAYLKSTASQGTYEVDGDLFGSQIHLEHVVATRQKSQKISGAVGFRHFDLAQVSRLLLPAAATTNETNDAPPDAFAGELDGDLVIDRLVTDDLQHAAMRFSPDKLVVTRTGQELALRPAKTPIELANDTIALPPLVFDLNAKNGLKGAVTVQGGASKVSRDPELSLSAELEPIDLGFLVGAVPKLNRAEGSLAGSLRITGPAKAPLVDGVLRVRDGEFAVQGLPGPISEVSIDVAADASEAQITRAVAKFAGGDLSAKGRVSLKGSSLGVIEATIAGHDLHFAPVTGASATLDCDLRLALNPNATGATARLPHVSGNVTVTAFDYTRATNIVPDIGGLKVGARRTNVENYDPSLDAIVIGPDLTIRAKNPLRIKNNLVEAQLGFDAQGVQVSGTNQRIGLRGELHALPGGHFHLFANDFEIQKTAIRFDDPTRIAPHVDAIATTEYRRYTNTSSTGATGAAASTTAGASAGGGAGGGRAGGLWRMSLHAYGDVDDLRLDMTSDPPLSQEDIFLLLTIGLTRAEVDQVAAGSVYASAAFEALGTASGADRAVKQAFPVIDDFRFGSAYSQTTGRSEPQITVGRRVTDNVRAAVSTGLTEDRQLRANIEWRLSRRVSVSGTYDNIDTIGSSAIGNVGVDLRWRLEFE